LVDGNFIPFKKQGKISEILAIVKGDQKSFSIAAASIIAKETRDQIMCDLDQKYPQYGFAKHAGYPTQFHREKIREHGICEFHRKSFEPIKSILHANS
jgi:ribonuclease HII